MIAIKPLSTAKTTAEPPTSGCNATWTPLDEADVATEDMMVPLELCVGAGLLVSVIGSELVEALSKVDEGKVAQVSICIDAYDYRGSQVKEATMVKMR